MATEKTKSPKGELVWVTITGEGKENLNGKMQYKADMILDPANEPAHQAYLDSLKAFWDENKPKNHKKKPKSLGWYLNDPVVDDEGNPVLDDEGEKQYVEIKDGGKVRLSFKTATTFPDGKAKVVKVYNSKAKRVDLGEIMIGNGSIGYISGAVGTYNVMDPTGKKIIDAGVTLYLDAIQLLKLVKYEGADPGFEAADEDELDEGEGFTGVGEDEDFEEAGESEGKKPRL